MMETLAIKQQISYVYILLFQVEIIQPIFLRTFRNNMIQDINNLMPGSNKKSHTYLNKPAPFT